MENKKKIIMAVLSVLVCVMAVGYAVLATQLNINGSASIDSTWRVEITNITPRDIVGDAVSKEAPSYTTTTANFSVGLTQPTDSITYDIEVTNSGTLDAVLESINVSMEDNDAIIYTTSGLKKGDKLAKNGGKNTLTVKVEYNPEVTSQPANTEKELTVTLNYEQDLGQVVAYDYVIGDIINFAGSNWYVIKNSTSEEEHVTLLKEKGIRKEELGEYAISYQCDSEDIRDGYRGCSEEVQMVRLDAMSYYWSDTCHPNSYGYTEGDYSGCEGHNDYEGSKVREFLEGIYINTLEASSLKEVDGYKVRLISWSELLGNLGYSMDITSGGFGEHPIANDNVPLWVYQNFSDSDSDVYAYWTETSHPIYNSLKWQVTNAGNLDSSKGVYDYGVVRPVINLLKTSIQ